MFRPWPGGNIARLDEFPIADIFAAHSKIVAHGRRNIQTRALVQIGERPLIAEHILPVVGAKRSTILPLRIAIRLPRLMATQRPFSTLFPGRSKACLNQGIALRASGLVVPRVTSL